MIKAAIIKNPFYAKSAYEYAIKNLVKEKRAATLIIDGKRSLSYEKMLKKAVRDRGVSFVKLKTGNDESYSALQVADLCAGIIRSHHERPKDLKVDQLYRVIERKITETVFN